MDKYRKQEQETNKKIYCGIDFHKNTSTLCTVYEDGSLVEPVTTIQTKLLVKYLSNRKTWKMGIEVTGGVNHVVEQLRGQGHDVVLIDPNKFRGIGVGGKKTDERDAESLAHCLRMNYIPQVHLRSVSSRQIKSLLTTREHCVQNRCRAINHVRGTLREYGKVMPMGVEAFYSEARPQIESLENELIKGSLLMVFENIKTFIEQEKQIEKSLHEMTKGNPLLKSLQSIPGVGPMTAMTMIAVIDDITRFKNAKEFSSYLGLVPSVHASANKRMMGGITRSGCEMLRRYLIHGARAWLRYSSVNGDSNRVWAEAVKTRCGQNKATVALAHRMARICFAVMRDQSVYKQTIKRSVVEDGQEKIPA